jgi:hypothetical protein
VTLTPRKFALSPSRITDGKKLNSQEYKLFRFFRGNCDYSTWIELRCAILIFVCISRVFYDVLVFVSTSVSVFSHIIAVIPLLLIRREIRTSTEASSCENLAWINVRRHKQY